MISAKTIMTVKAMLEPAAAAGVIPGCELAELLELAGQPDINDRLVTRKEAADMLRIHISSLDRAARQGIIRRIKVTGRPLYSIREISKLKEKGA